MQNPILKTISVTNRLSSEVRILKNRGFSKWRRMATPAMATPAMASSRSFSVMPEQEKYVVNSVYPDIEIPNENLATYTWKYIKNHENLLASVSVLYNIIKLG